MNLLLDAVIFNIYILAPPQFIRKSKDSITIYPIHMIGQDGLPLIPYGYQLYCKKVDTRKLSLNDILFPGTAATVRCVDGDAREMTVTGLSPDTNYVLAVVAVDKDGKIIGEGIGHSTPEMCTSLPLPIPLCWSYLIHQCEKSSFLKSAIAGHDVLHGFFVQSLSKTTELLKFSSPQSVWSSNYTTFELNYENVKDITSSIVCAYIQCLFDKTERSLNEHSKTVVPDISGKFDIVISLLIL